MLFFDRRRRMSRLLSQEKFAAASAGVSPFSSQTTTPTASECGCTSLLSEQTPNEADVVLCRRCSSHACRWFPSLTFADWIFLQLVLGAVLLLVLSAIAGVYVYSLVKELDIDLARVSRYIYVRGITMSDYYM